MKHRLHFVHRKRNVVDAPFVDALVGGIVLGEHHLDGFIRRRSVGAGFFKQRVIPFIRRGLDPVED
jgi:hypothetical protein